MPVQGKQLMNELTAIMYTRCTLRADIVGLHSILYLMILLTTDAGENYAKEGSLIAAHGVVAPSSSVTMRGNKVILAELPNRPKAPASAVS